MAEQNIKARCPVWVKIVLGVSLALNLAIAGLAAGAFLRGGPLRDRGPVVAYALPYVVALPKDARRAVYDALRDDPTLPDRRARRASYDEMATALLAEPFDRAAIEAILLQQGTVSERVQSVARAQWLDVVAQMSTEDRIAYVDRVKEVLKRGGKRQAKR